MRVPEEDGVGSAGAGASVGREDGGERVARVLGRDEDEAVPEALDFLMLK